MALFVTSFHRLRRATAEVRIKTLRRLDSSSYPPNRQKTGRAPATDLGKNLRGSLEQRIVLPMWLAVKMKVGHCRRNMRNSLFRKVVVDSRSTTEEHESACQRVDLGAAASVRVSSKRALMEVAHSLLIVAYVLIKPGCIYEDLDFKALGTR